MKKNLLIHNNYWFDSIGLILKYQRNFISSQVTVNLILK